ncbi:DUF6151 family protein [Enterovibrio coralii]|uniref:DUF6151 family protein n=1 Tax=Enterovibrio coralii TaxID=294935 RepID=UPI000B15597F|nr:DUF6151 family protein [Enterovibrio coralii]
MSELTIRCECGTLTGVLEDVSPKRGNHMMCYCDDCQRYARYLGDAEKWLDEWGGTEVFQVAPAKIKILTGADQLKCVRLKPKGIYRYYAKCCRTPIANTISYKTAFAGLPVAILHGENKDALLGPITHAVMELTRTVLRLSILTQSSLLALL